MRGLILGLMCMQKDVRSMGGRKIQKVRNTKRAVSAHLNKEGICIRTASHKQNRFCIDAHQYVPFPPATSTCFSLYHTLTCKDMHPIVNHVYSGWDFLRRGFKHWHTDGRNILTERWAMLKNKRNLVTCHESILVSLCNYQQTRVYVYGLTTVII